MRKLRRETGIDVDLFVASLDCACLVLKPDLTAVAVSDSYVMLLGSTRSNILGKKLRELPGRFGSATLAWSLEQVIKFRAPNTVAMDQEVALVSEKGNDNSRALIATNSAVIDSFGNVRCLLHRLDDLGTLAEWRRECSLYKEALQFQEKMFTAFMDHAPVLAWMKDMSGRILYVNRAVMELFPDRRYDEIVGKIDLEWLPEEVSKAIRETDKLVTHTKESVQAVEQFHDASGQMAEFLTIKFPVEHNGLTYLGATGIDLALQRRYDEMQSFLANIVEHSQDAIVGLDLNGIITSWNKGAADLYGYDQHGAVGCPISMIWPDAPNGTVEQLKAGMSVGPYETVHAAKTGLNRSVLVSLSPVKNGPRLVGASMIARDITALKETQLQLEEANVQLTERVYELAQLAAELQTARDQALEASIAKSAFATNVSHELRTPLSAIIGLNGLMMRSLTGDNFDLARTVQENANSLLTVVNDIVDISRLEQGKVVLDDAGFNPIRVVNDCYQLMHDAAQRKDLDLQRSVDGRIPNVVYGDANRLKQLLLKLLSNAVKFTDRGGVSLSANLVCETPETVTIEFSVKDTGIGISTEQQKALFSPFGQLDSSSTRKFGGAGVGLYIAKRLVEMMNGRMDLVSHVDQGSTFSATLIFERGCTARNTGSSAPMIKLTEPIAPAFTKDRKILIVEDNPVLQRLAIKQLKTLGLEAQATMSGIDGVTLASSGQFALVLMDINLPDITGFEATQRIRDYEKQIGIASIPIVAMTAGAMRGDRQAALDAGMNDYLAKPVAIELLKEVLEFFLTRDGQNV